MDVQATKIELALLLLNTDNVSVLNKIKTILKTEKKDWWDELTKEQQDSIDEGCAEIDRGEYVTWEEVKKQIAERKMVKVDA